MDTLSKMMIRAAMVSGHIAQLPEWPRLKVEKPKIRWSEARAFRKVDIFESHIVFAVTFGRSQDLKNVKGFNEEPFPLHAELEQLLESVPKNLTPFIFVNPRTGRPYTKHITKIWNKACKDAGVLRVPLYQATRHSFVCQMLNSGIDKSMVQRLLRHTDPKITDRYAEYSTNSLRVKLDNVFRINRQETVRKAKRAETSG
jgi:integrase